MFIRLKWTENATCCCRFGCECSTEWKLSEETVRSVAQCQYDRWTVRCNTTPFGIKSCVESHAVYNILSYRFIRALRQRQRNAYIVKTGICTVWLAVWYTHFSLIAPHRIKADINKRTEIRQPHQNNSKFCIWKHFSFHNEIEWKKEHNIIVKPLWFRCIYHTPWIAISYQCLTLGMHVYDCKPCDTHPNIQVVEKQIDTKIHKKTQPTIWIYK